jgi:hypothetical protein
MYDLCQKSTFKSVLKIERFEGGKQDNCHTQATADMRYISISESGAGP